MMVYEVIFEWFIFALLCILTCMLFYLYIKPLLYKAFQAYLEHKKELRAKQHLAFHTQQKMAADLTEQRKALATIDEKLHTWHTKIKDKRILEIAHKETILTKMQAKKIAQLERLHDMYAQRRIVPKAITLAQKELKQKFAHEDGKALLSRLIKKLEKQTLS